MRFTIKIVIIFFLIPLFFAAQTAHAAISITVTGNWIDETIDKNDFYSDGSNIYGEPGKAPRSNADWITFSPHRLIIPPKGVAQVNYTVTVPNNETLAGTYWSMMMIEGISSILPDAVRQEKDKITVRIKQVMRYGAQMITQIGDTGTRKLKFVKTKVLKTDDKRILQIDIENTGQRWLRPDLWVELYDEKGISAGKFEGGKLRIYPGTSVRFRIDLSRVPKGTYKAMVVADCGGEDLFGATYTLKFE
ncbi:hypothetical protein [Desulfobacula sp.]|uniref:hypothetical protein n=1 Tax=Desulfobacula sp. TaxID=2593537 RepID=UPI0027146C2F|nr:hypothetical protein [Desulfobacula sp.]